MKKKSVINLLLSLAAIVSFSSCKNDYSFVKDFPEKGQIDYETVPYNAAEINLLSINPLPGGLRLCQLMKSEHHFALLDKDMNEIVRFGRSGRGPEEFIYAMYEGVTGISADSLSLLVRDWVTGSLYSVAVSLHDGNTHSSLIREFPMLMRKISPLGDGKFLCNNNANRYYFDDNGVVTYFEGWGEDINEALENPEIYVPDNQTSDFFSPDSTRLLVYSGSYPILYLHSMKDGSLLNKTYVEMRPEEFPEDESCPLSFGGGGYVGDHIALLLCDDVNETSRILIFDKNLKPLVSYDVPLINTLDIDPDTGEALSLDYENELIYKFDLSQWL